MCVFVGPLIPLFWTSSDVCSEFQKGFIYNMYNKWRKFEKRRPVLLSNRTLNQKQYQKFSIIFVGKYNI